MARPINPCAWAKFRSSANARSKAGESERHRVVSSGELEESVKAWLAEPGPALLHVKVKPMQLVTPPSPFVSPEAVVGMAVYSARAMLQGKGHDVWEMMVENIP